MGTPVVRLGAWCDLETEDEARRRLGAAAAETAAVDDPADPAAPRPGLFVPVPGTPVLSPGGIHFRVEEFAVLADGRRIRLHGERGFGLSAGADPWRFQTLESLARDVRTTVLPDDAEDTGEDHPWEWLVELLRARGVEASPDELRALPYDVEFSDRLRARVSAGG
ncbi:hypothetical protein GCU56_15660 [Geodermatophilus sabuli]|uniref:Uncharacterized protein n=1 Tax=Geodermatophilus sabuli TaxID=1564158 RepID=A0A7K3W330_9ACTN|nr:hypothetical protein [Geodermatophilus sabuli]NEK59301.1 hypothetical protein [Geodermatophilus sabuli]